MNSWIFFGVVVMLAFSGCSTTFGSSDGTETQTSAMPQFSISTSVDADVTVSVKKLTSNETVFESTYNMRSGETIRLRDQLEHKKYYINVSVEGGEEREWRLGQNQGIDIRITAKKKLVVENNSVANIGQ
jgi:hypothetical protein